MTFVRRFLCDENGPTAVEYALLLSLIVVVCISAVKLLGTNSAATFNSTANAIGNSSSSGS